MLAGLVKREGDTVDVSLEKFRKPLKLQGNVEEIKFSKLYAKGDSVTLNTYTHMTFEDAQVELDRVANL